MLSNILIINSFFHTVTLQNSLTVVCDVLKDYFRKKEVFHSSVNVFSVKDTEIYF